MATTLRPAPVSNGRKARRETVTIEDISPKMAEKYLGENASNRNLRPHRVGVFVGILQRGEWELTGDAAVFDENGFLINAQHRLNAVVESGITAPFIVLRGVPAKSQEVMDRVLQRSLADALKLRGHVNVFVLSSALNWLYRLDYIRATGNVHYSTPEDRPTTQQALRVLAKYKNLPDAIRRTQQVRNKLKARHGVMAALYCEFTKIDADNAEAFFDQLEEGTDLSRTDPIYLLRRALLSDIGATRRMTDWRQAALTCKAWNAWRDGRPMSQLAWKYGATQREEFPLPE